MKGLTSGPGLPAGERRERERGGAVEGWGQPVSEERRDAGAGGRAGGRRAVWPGGGEAHGRELGRKRPNRGGESFPFSFSNFYFFYLFFF
jgi:hypothetical protein